MTHVVWDHVTREDVFRAIREYDRLGPGGFFSAHGFGPTTTYDLVWEERLYPPKAILGTAYELATGRRLASGDFEGGKSGAVKVLGNLGFAVAPRSRATEPAGSDIARSRSRGPTSSIGRAVTLRPPPCCCCTASRARRRSTSSSCTAWPVATT